MSTLIILVCSFFLLWLLNIYALNRFLTLSLIGRIAMGIMLLFTGSSHFFKTSEMVLMMPAFMPYKTLVVHLTGAMELAFAIALIIPRYSKWTAIVLIVFLLAILPANIIGSFKEVSLGGMEHGPTYLYFRIPLQFLFIAWTYYFGIRLAKAQRETVKPHPIRTN
jgi:uncharacterized membrane protein